MDGALLSTNLGGRWDFLIPIGRAVQLQPYFGVMVPINDSLENFLFLVLFSKTSYFSPVVGYYFLRRRCARRIIVIILLLLSRVKWNVRHYFWYHWWLQMTKRGGWDNTNNNNDDHKYFEKLIQSTTAPMLPTIGPIDRMSRMEET